MRESTLLSLYAYFIASLNIVRSCSCYPLKQSNGSTGFPVLGRRKDFFFFFLSYPEIAGGRGKFPWIFFEGPFFCCCCACVLKEGYIYICIGRNDFWGEKHPFCTLYCVLFFYSSFSGPSIFLWPPFALNIVILPHTQKEYLTARIIFPNVWTWSLW